MIDDQRQVNIIQEATAFAQKNIKPYASTFEENEAVPRELIDKMAAMGYLAATFPEKYGGLELDPYYYGLLTEEIGKACCSTRSLLTVHTSLVGETILRCGSETQKDKWIKAMATGEKIGAFALTEPEIGSDARNVRCTYSKSNDKYIINGKKKWITYGDIADFFIVIAASNGTVSAFIVERGFEGVSTKPIKGLLACKAAYIAEIELCNVAVPSGNILGREGAGFNYVAATALDHGRYSIAWSGVAIAQAALEEMVTYSRSREQFNEKIHHFQLIKGMIGDAVTKTHAARALCIRAGNLRRDNEKESMTETTIAKYFTSKVAMQIALDAVQVLGGNGCCNKFRAERLFREAKILEIIEGTSQIQQEIISRYGLKHYYRKEY